MGLPVLERNDPLNKSKRFRTELPGDSAKLFQIESGATVRKYNGNLATGATTLYTCPPWKRAITQPGLYFIHNPTAGAISMDFHHVPSGGSVNNNNKLASISVAARETRTVISSSLWHCVMPGDSLVINPGTVGLNAWGIMQEIRESAAAFIGGYVGNIAAATTTTILTCPALRTLVLANILTHNYNAGSVDVYAYARESGVAVSDSNKVMSVLTLTTGSENALDAFLIPAVGQGGLVTVLSSLTNVNFWANAVLL